MCAKARESNAYIRENKGQIRHHKARSPHGHPPAGGTKEPRGKTGSTNVSAREKSWAKSVTPGYGIPTRSLKSVKET